MLFNINNFILIEYFKHNKLINTKGDWGKKINDLDLLFKYKMYPLGNWPNLLFEKLFGINM